jgi:hypothetical protein
MNQSKKEKILQEYKKILEQERKCALCNITYKMKDTIGQFQCKYHPEQIDDYLQYTCCGRFKGAKGCYECDHHELSFFSDVSYDVPLDFYVPNSDGERFCKIPKKPSRVTDDEYPRKSKRKGVVFLEILIIGDRRGFIDDKYK